jgi:hypothetical protein
MPAGPRTIPISRKPKMGLKDSESRETTKKSAKKREENQCIDTWIIDIWICGYINV